MIPVLIVPILTGPELLYRMLDSIDYPVERLIVVDNGDCVSQFRLTEHAKPLCTWVTHLRMPSNLGVPQSWNLGIKATPHAPWWMVSNYDLIFEPGSLERFATESARGAVTLTSATPGWCCFTVGDVVVDRVGLFDEAFYPAYFEDWDYSARCDSAGIEVVQSTIPVQHINSATITSGIAHRNGETFQSNQAYYQGKVDRGDRSEGGWSLARRRGNAWD
jgi:GT2 family glycosyltransferase